MRIYKVTMIDGDNWTGAADSFADAVKTACKAFLAPERAVKNVRAIKDIN